MLRPAEMRAKAAFACALILGLLTGTASLLGQLNQRFESVAPAPGESAPDVTLYTPEGKAVRLPEALKGQYSVVILGCLT